MLFRGLHEVANMPHSAPSSFLEIRRGEVFIKIFLRNRTSDIILVKRMKFEVEGPDLRSVYLQQILDILRGGKSVIYTHYSFINQNNVNIFLKILGRGGGGGGER